MNIGTLKKLSFIKLVTKTILKFNFNAVLYSIRVSEERVKVTMETLNEAK